MIATGDDSEPALRLRLTGEGGCVFLDGTCGIGKSGMGSPLGTMSVEKGGQMELFGLARLEITGPTALMPMPPRILAQVMSQ